MNLSIFDHALFQSQKIGFLSSLQIQVDFVNLNSLSALRVMSQSKAFQVKVWYSACEQTVPERVDRTRGSDRVNDPRLGEEHG